MQASLEQIEKQALSLTAEERARLAEAMLESLNAPIAEVEQAWAEEVAQRVAAYDRGDLPANAPEDVFAGAKRIAK